MWSSQLTYRKFGHYQWDIDTVMVSKTLDNSRTPRYVIDFVMFHELLHKKLGVNLVNGRRMAHTTRFRNAEKEFRQYQQAKEYLNRIAKKKT